MEESENAGAYKPSSDENNHQTDATIKETEASSKRSYECVYCKMGFTNAQALGGHMNIHRKDRANHSAPSSSSPSGPIPIRISTSLTSSRSHSIVDAPVTSTAHFIGPLLSELEKFGTYWPTLETLCRPVLQTGTYKPVLRVSMSSASSRMSCDRDEDLTPNLSLQVGSYSYWENAEEIKGGERMEKIDLELRLGRDP